MCAAWHMDGVWVVAMDNHVLGMCHSSSDEC